MNAQEFGFLDTSPDQRRGSAATPRRARGGRAARLGALGAICIAAALAACSLKTVTYTPETGPGSDAGSNEPAPATCSDHTKNGNETDADCGGDCAPCAVGQVCASNTDCTSGSCQDATCRAASCADQRQNGDETAVDCGGSCGPCADGQACNAAADCRSELCANQLCTSTCGDDVQDGTETALNCGGVCPPCALGLGCAVDADCADAGVCDTTCRVARSCAEILQHFPGSSDGVYTIAPDANAASFGAVCDMTRDGGGWTLLLKADGTATLAFDAAAWTDTSLLAPTDLTTQPGNAKYQGFLSLPITALRGELDGFTYTKEFTSQTAKDIFSNDIASNIATGFPVFGQGAFWSAQPNCRIFGVNTPGANTLGVVMPYLYARTRFGWSANQEDNCTTNDTAIGLGLTNYMGTGQHGAGYECLAGGADCVDQLAVDQAGNGLLWGR